MVEKAKEETKVFQEDLEKHLRKCELEYRAATLPKGCCVDWLEPFCGSTREIAEYLRYLGFKIREIVDEIDCSATEHRHVETTSGIIIWVNGEYTRGFMCRSARNRRKDYA